MGQEEKHTLFSTTGYNLVLPESGDIELGGEIRHKEGKGMALGQIRETDATLLLVP